MEPKQVIVIRKDLKMRRGKEMAQASHASLKAVLDCMNKSIILETAPRKNRVRWSIELAEEDPMALWIGGIFTKIVVGCDSEAELLEIYNKAKAVGLNTCLITDCGLTEFKGVPTNTCIAIGPDDPEKINKITGHLKLL